LGFCLQLKALLFSERMRGKAYELFLFYSRTVVAPEHVDAGSGATHTSCDCGSLATPTAPQMTDVDPNRCGEPMKPLKGAHAPQGGEKVRLSLKPKRLIDHNSLGYEKYR
jgi:hypothetical protein